MDSTAADVSKSLGTNEKFKQEIAVMMRLGISGVLVLDVAENMSAILGRLQGLGGRILKTNVDSRRCLENFARHGGHSEHMLVYSFGKCWRPLARIADLIIAGNMDQFAKISDSSGSIASPFALPFEESLDFAVGSGIVRSLS
jgi:hypothetical protein